MSTLLIINVAMTTRIMLAKLNQDDMLIGTNYGMRRRKMEFLLTEHDLCTYLTTAMVAPIEGAALRPNIVVTLRLLKLGPRRIIVLAILC